MQTLAPIAKPSERQEDKLQRLFHKFREMEGNELCTFKEFRKYVVDKEFISKLQQICGDKNMNYDKRVASKEFLDIIYDSSRFHQNMQKMKQAKQ